MSFPPFRPHPLLRGGHLQTLAAQYLGRKTHCYGANQHQVSLPDGDVLVLHDDQPDTWQTGDPAVLLLHGLGGCHLSPYMQRLSAKFPAAGWRAFRIDFRGCGAGHGCARRPYNAGQSGDIRIVLQFLQELCPGSPLGVIGFSLGGNMLLKMLGEDPGEVPAAVTRAAVVSPAIDLVQTSQNIKRLRNRLYERHFIKLLNLHIRDFAEAVKEHCPSGLSPARTLWEFDHRFTAPIAGFESAQQYYERSSSAPLLSRIQIPTYVLAAADDPLIPVRIFERADWPEVARVEIPASGGHVGFIGRKRQFADNFWMDWRLLDWFQCR